MKRAIGIDIGKEAITVCTANSTSTARLWTAHTIRLKDNWDEELRAICGPFAIAAAEPTGWHYLAPIAAALKTINTQLWLIPTHLTSKIRAVHVSGGKSDNMDARALAVAAQWLKDGEEIRGAYPFNIQAAANISSLRATLLNYTRSRKERTRCLNRLDQIAQAIWPLLAEKKNIWLRAVNAGAVTPEDLHALAAKLLYCEENHEPYPPGYEHGRTRRNLIALANALPAYLNHTPPTLRQSALEIITQVNTFEQAAEDALTTIQSLIIIPTLAETTRRWMTIPHASPLSIATLHAATNGRTLSYSIDEFKTAIGASPQRARSGQQDRQGKNRPGYRPAMQQMWFWTARLIRENNNPVADYYQQLTERNHPHAFHAAITKLARILWGVAHTGDYHYPKPTLTNADGQPQRTS